MLGHFGHSQQEDAKDIRSRAGRWAGEFSGAFADLGTFLPLVVGVLAVSGLHPNSVLIGFGLFALATALVYRRPVPVQPMKAVAALAITAGLSADAIIASGLLIGVTLVVLAVTGVIERIARLVPHSVLAGVQLGIGLQLALYGLHLMSGHVAAGAVLIAAIVVILCTPAGAFAGLAMLIGGTAYMVASEGSSFPELSPGFYLPELALPDAAALLTAFKEAVPAQLALTLTNAVLVTAALAAVLFPEGRERISPRRLALSSGILNMILAPFGAMPMCHGAGGLVVQYKFGARGALAPALFGTACLALGLFLGGNAIGLLALIPATVLGALLAVAGGELALTKRLFDGKPGCLIVIVITGLTCLAVNAAVALGAGLAVEAARGWLVRWRNSSSGAEPERGCQ